MYRIDPEMFDLTKREKQPSVKGFTTWAQLKWDDPMHFINAANEYFKWVEENPLYNHQAMKGRGGNIEIVKVPVKRPLLFEGYTLMCRISSKVIRQIEMSYPPIGEIIGVVRCLIAHDQLGGATAGEYNATMVSKILGLNDKVDHEVHQKTELTIIKNYKNHEKS